MASKGKQFKALLHAPEILVMPGVYDGYSVRLAERSGFKAASISGAGVSESRLGWLDRGIIDSIINALAYIYRGAAAFVSIFGDRWLIDNSVDTFAARTWDLALSMRSIQTGRVRQYVMFIVVGTVVLFVIATIWWNRTATAG